MNHEGEDDLKAFQLKYTDRIVATGFDRCIYDTSGVISIHWTAEGTMLEGLLKRLFDVPATAPNDVDSDEILLIIGILLFAAPKSDGK